MLFEYITHVVPWLSIIQTNKKQTKQTMHSENCIFESFFQINSILFFHNFISWDKGWSFYKKLNFRSWEAIVWRNRWKLNWSSPAYFPPLCIHRDSRPFSVHNNRENWTKWFFDYFWKWSASRLLDHLWNSKLQPLSQLIWKNKFELILRNLSK